MKAMRTLYSFDLICVLTPWICSFCISRFTVTGFQIEIGEHKSLKTNCFGKILEFVLVLVYLFWEDFFVGLFRFWAVLEGVFVWFVFFPPLIIWKYIVQRRIDSLKGNKEYSESAWKRQMKQLQERKGRICSWSSALLNCSVSAISTEQLNVLYISPCWKEIHEVGWSHVNYIPRKRNSGLGG